jgi:hypothetical protein
MCNPDRYNSHLIINPRWIPMSPFPAVAQFKPDTLQQMGRPLHSVTSIYPALGGLVLFHYSTRSGHDGGDFTTKRVNGMRCPLPTNLHLVQVSCLLSPKSHDKSNRAIAPLITVMSLPGSAARPIETDKGESHARYRDSLKRDLEIAFDIFDHKRSVPLIRNALSIWLRHRQEGIHSMEEPAQLCYPFRNQYEYDVYKEGLSEGRSVPMISKLVTVSRHWRWGFPLRFIWRA